MFTFGPFRLNDANGTLLRDGEPLPVGQRAVRLLQAVLERPGEVLTKTELMDAAWPDVRRGVRTDTGSEQGWPQEVIW